MDDIYQMAQMFHQKFDDRAPKKPVALTDKEAGFRAEFMLEELFEFLVADTEDKEEIKARAKAFHEALDRAVNKSLTKVRPQNETIVKQSDALGDLIYLAYGTFVLMGVDPKDIINSIHQANMDKLFADGKPHYDERTHKVLKADSWQGPEAGMKAAVKKQQ